MVHAYEPLILTSQRLQILRALEADQGIKRRHRLSDSSTSDDDEDDLEVAGLAGTESSRGDDDEQDEIEEFVKGPDFPHAPLIRASNRPKTIREQLAEPAQKHYLKVQHFHVLGAIINKCLQDEDFARARKAFSLLLRFNVNAKRVNIRRHGLWGVGAELILRRNTVSTSYAWESNGLKFSKQSIEAVRAYYERIVLQYPPLKSRPNDINAQDFFPAMFGLWILQVQARTQRIRASLAAEEENTSMPSSAHSDSDNGSTSDSDGPSDRDSNVSLSSSTSRPRTFTRSSLRHAQRFELRQARKIATRMDETFYLPPYSNDGNLLELRGNVDLWTAYLISATGGTKQEAEEHRQGATESFRRAAEARGTNADIANDNYREHEEERDDRDLRESVERRSDSY